VLVAAAVTFDAQKAVLQQSAFQVLFELPADELGEMATRALDLLHELRIILSNDGIECCLIRSMPMVGSRDGDRRRSRHALIGWLRALLALRANRTLRQPALDMNGGLNPVMLR
jgi:hypothetical protein